MKLIPILTLTLTLTVAGQTTPAIQTDPNQSSLGEDLTHGYHAQNVDKYNFLGLCSQIEEEQVNRPGFSGGRFV